MSNLGASCSFLTLRVSSITTRIKTPLIFLIEDWGTLWEYLPLQQGLRLHEVCLHCLSCLALRVSSITTRIKTFINRIYHYFLISLRVSSITTRIKTVLCSHTSSAVSPLRKSSIRTRIKTSLRYPLGLTLKCLWAYLPLKQGLRLHIAPV